MESTLKFLADKVLSTGEGITDMQNVGTNERLVSVLAGITLTYLGLQRSETLLGKAMSIAGGMLITRGTTGFCPMNKALNRNSLLTEAIH